MRLAKHIRILASFALMPLVGNTALSNENVFAAGLYQITGFHSQLGNYDGLLLVKDNSEVQRAIKLGPFTPEQNRKLGLQADQNFSIEQLWQGQRSSAGLQFQIRASNVLTSVNGYNALASDLAFENVLLESTKSTFQLKNNGVYSETYTLISKIENGSQAADLFAKDSRLKLDAYGKTGSFLVDLAGWAGVNHVINEYRKLPHFDPYREREEFKRNQVFQIKDLTDLDFYRTNPSILRVRNMSLTPLSIGEALQRRAAFHPTLAEKAEFKQIETQSVMNSLGIFEVGMTDANGQIVSLQAQGDTALWFGVYIWSLSLEHQVTKTKDSYQRLKAALEGMNHLIEISPDPRRFARYIHKSPPEETATDPNILQGLGKYRDYKYDSRSNNDMVKGFLLGYLVAYKALKDEDRELREKISALVRRIQRLDPVTEKAGNRAAAKGLDALWNENLSSLVQYIDGSDGLTSKLSDALNVDSGFHIGGMTNPSGIHLNLMSQSIRYYLADTLIQKVKENGKRMYIPIPQTELSAASYQDPTPRLAAIKRSAARNIKSLSVRMKEAHFNYLNIAAYAITRDPNLKQRAVESTSALVEVPKTRSAGRLYGDLYLQPDWMYSTWPFEPWKALKGPWMIRKEKLSTKNQQRGMLGYPLFECAALSSTYIWVSGTNDFPCDGNPNVISFSADYLWAYWLARSADVISERD